MRAYPMTQVAIDHVEQSVLCEGCNTLHALAGEKLGSFGFIVQACRLARRHMGCSTRSRATVARELAEIMHSEFGIAMRDEEEDRAEAIAEHPESENLIVHNFAAGAGGVQ